MYRTEQRTERAAVALVGDAGVSPRLFCTKQPGRELWLFSFFSYEKGLTFSFAS